MIAPNDDASKRRTVMLVDDDEAVRDVSRRLLEALGFSVVTAHDGKTAINTFLAGREQFLLALVDLTMPKMSGEETLRELRRLAPTLPLVLMSGYPESDIAAGVAAIGLAGYLQKPFRLPTLAAAIRRAMGE